MPENGEDLETGAPPRRSPPKPKRESIVIEGKSSESKEPDPAPAPPPKARIVDGVALGAIGGVIGAVLTLGGVWLFDSSPDAAALARRVDGLEAASGSAAAERHALAEKLAAAEAALAQPKTDATGDLSKQIAALQEEQSAAAADRKSLTDALAKRQSTPLDDLLEKRVAALEAVAADARAAAEKALAAATAPKPDARVEQLATDQSALADRLAKGADTLESRLAKLEAAAFSPKDETRVAPAESVTETDRASQPTARAVAALALADRLREGEPYAPELAALERAGVEPAALNALKPFAEMGLPTLAALSRGYAEVEPGSAAVARLTSVNGAVGALLGEVQGLVKVHKAGEAPVAEPEAVAVRIEGALQRGDLAGAAAAARDWPEATQGPAKAWVDTVEARLAAVQAAEALLARSIGDLGAARK